MIDRPGRSADANAAPPHDSSAPKKSCGLSPAESEYVREEWSDAKVGLFMLLLVIPVGIVVAVLTNSRDPDPRFKPADIPSNQMYSDEWWFWLIVGSIALCCLLIGIGYLWLRPSRER
ncbi:MAG TPA: hypothetical protein VJL90_03975 [Pseudorhodoplanes sp.]|nr:hypothetical protein [Pseudorhodoplanes sp.]